VILVCAMGGNTEAEENRLAAKIAKFRIFKDEEGRMNRSVLEAKMRCLKVFGERIAAVRHRLSDQWRSNRSPRTARPPKSTSASHS